MGYASQVVIALNGKKEDVSLALTMYQASETQEQIDSTWHILCTGNGYADFFYDTDTLNMDVVWRFNWVKFYDESMEALRRLGNIVQTLHDEHGAELSLVMRRMGEDYNDYEDETWGVQDFPDYIEVVRHLDVHVPTADIKQFFENKTAWGGKIQGDDNASK